MIIYPSTWQGLITANEARHWWLMPVILATWEAEIKRVTIPGKLGQKEQDPNSAKKAGCSGGCLSAKAGSIK
jgi:hypothetical protein